MQCELRQSFRQGSPSTFHLQSKLLWNPWPDPFLDREYSPRQKARCPCGRSHIRRGPCDLWETPAHCPGPLLFIAFINDLQSVVNTQAYLFADDRLLLRPIDSLHDSNKLQEDLSALEKWESESQMSFDPHKCATIRVARKKIPLETRYQLPDHTLEVVDGGKYLRTHISNDLSWQEHIRQTKATISLGFPRCYLHSCLQNVRAQAYTTQVRPALEYASTL